jgi:hypothetical protein
MRKDFRAYLDTGERLPAQPSSRRAAKINSICPAGGAG